MARNRKHNTMKVVEFETTSTLEVVSPELKSKKEKKIRFQLLLKKLEAKVVLKENQLVYSKKIEDNIITICYGPAGCLTENQKISIYKMRSKTFNGNTVIESNKERSFTDEKQ